MSSHSRTFCDWFITRESRTFYPFDHPSFCFFNWTRRAESFERSLLIRDEKLKLRRTIIIFIKLLRGFARIFAICVTRTRDFNRWRSSVKEKQKKKKKKKKRNVSEYFTYSVFEHSFCSFLCPSERARRRTWYSWTLLDLASNVFYAICISLRLKRRRESRTAIFPWSIEQLFL